MSQNGLSSDCVVADTGSASATLPSRREVLVAAGAALATSGVAAAPAAAAPQTEGFFLIFEKKNAGNSDEPADTRVFFVKSEWLELFEVTEAYIQRGIAPSEVVDAIRTSSDQKVKKLRAYYSDNPDILNPLQGTLIDPPFPTGNQTYLAAMISPLSIP